MNKNLLTAIILFIVSVLCWVTAFEIRGLGGAILVFFAVMSSLFSGSHLGEFLYKIGR
jgi:hypothetical protein